VLHLTNGDSAAGSLRQSGLPGDVIVWADVLHEGPAPAEHGDGWRQARARYLSAAGHGAFFHVLRDYERADAALDRYREHDELVLWFEHDLFDQLLLARHLHWLGTQGQADTRLSLICIDRFPGFERFDGLGQLTPPQLGSLFPSRQPLTPAQLRAGADLWRAFTSDDPGGLNVVAQRGVVELPFAAGAIRRLLEEFPGVQDGLSRTERTVLEQVREGPRDWREVFLWVQRQEERVFMGDTTFWRIVRDLAAGRDPLVHVTIEQESARSLPVAQMAIAPAGQRAIGGEDAVRLRGIDRWIGGVHLTPDRLWRWDGAAVRRFPLT
jgi:hypothetical protein